MVAFTRKGKRPNRSRITRKGGRTLVVYRPSIQGNKGRTYDATSSILTPYRLDTLVSTYLDDAGLNTVYQKLITVSLLALFKVNAFKTLETKVEDAINAIDRINQAKNCKDRSTWIACEKDCNKVLKELISTEMNSTAYMLRAISKSILTVHPNKKQIKWSINKDAIGKEVVLTGIWDKDYANINIEFITPNDSERLIMGFGPSASGKTHWAKTIIELFSLSSPIFPKTFISIDGGIYREASMIYQMIIQATEKFCLGGLTNLVESGAGSGSLFDSGIIKKKVATFLQSKNRPFSLYVPETLGFCNFRDCQNKYIDFIQISNDNKWIGLVIWQHVTPDKCTLGDAYKCTGTTESGTSREKKEGKQYSSTSFKGLIDTHARSMSNGITEMNKAPGGRIMIHNAGRRGVKSIMEDYTDYFLPTSNSNIRKQLQLCDNQNKYGYIYSGPRSVETNRIDDKCNKKIPHTTVQSRGVSVVSLQKSSTSLSTILKGLKTHILKLYDIISFKTTENLLESLDSAISNISSLSTMLSKNTELDKQALEDIRSTMTQLINYHLSPNYKNLLSTIELAVKRIIQNNTTNTKNKRYTEYINEINTQVQIYITKIEMYTTSISESIKSANDRYSDKKVNPLFTNYPVLNKVNNYLSSISTQISKVNTYPEFILLQ